MGRRPMRRFLTLPRSIQRIRADVDDELRFDIEMRARDLMASGATPHEAFARAEREFGDLEATRRYCEDLDMQREADDRRADLFDDLRADLAIAWRATRRTPAFAAIVLLTLGLGIGANTAVFSVVRRVLIEPLPFRAPEQLYRLYTAPAQSDGDNDKLSAAELDMLAHESRRIAGVTAFGWIGSGTYTDDRTAEPWATVMVAPNFFDVLGTRVALGRPFNAADVQIGAPRVAIISYQRWQSNFGGDTRILDRPMEMDGVRYRIVGVLPENFLGPTFVADALYPLNFDAVLRSARASRSRVYRGIARVRSGVTLDQLRSELAVLRPRVQARYPEIRNGGVVIPKHLHAAIVGGAEPVLIVVMVGVVVVLVVTCVNIAGLFLSRAVARRRELGVRAALGAGRSRLVRQVVTESALYGLAGGVLGIAIATGLQRAFLVLVGDVLPKMNGISLSAGLLGGAVVASLICGIAFGILPALSATRIDVREALGESGSRSSSPGRSGTRASRVLVSAQIACAVLLVVGAGLLTRTFFSLVHTDLGYQASRQQLTFGLIPSFKRYPDPAARAALLHSVTERLKAIPDVTAAGMTAVTPWQGGMMSVPMRIEGRPVDDNEPSIEFATASPEYFSALGIPVRKGRVFATTDQQSAPPVIIISEAVARRFWPNADPIGSRVRIDTGVQGDSDLVREVVGVVADVREDALSPIVPTIYVPAGQFVGAFSGTFVVRTTGDAAALLQRVKQILHGIDPKMPLFYPLTLRDVLARSVARQELAMGLMVAFAVLALLLAALGIYGIVAYAVIARTREFGIRSALGASRQSILALVLRQGLTTAAAGIVCGLGLAVLLSRFMASLLVGVSVHDTLTFVLAPAALAVVAVIACVIPARAATRVQPVEALRAE